MALLLARTATLALVVGAAARGLRHSDGGVAGADDGVAGADAGVAGAGAGPGPAAAAAPADAARASALRGRRAPGDSRPNLVLFFPDTISAEAFGPLYGHPLVRTPRFDAWVRDGGALFSTAYASFPQCSPSRAALVTGRHVHTLGHRTMTHLVRPDEPNLWAMLKSVGYTTLHFGKNDMLAAASFEPSFSYWQDGTGVSQGASPWPFGEAGYYSFDGSPGAALGNDTAASGKNGDLRAVVAALSALNASGLPEPFALFLPGLGAHPPYGGPRDYFSMYTADEVRAAGPPLRRVNDTVGKPPYYGAAGIRGFRNYSALGDDAHDQWLYHVAATYFGRVSYVDYIFGVLLDGLAALGLGDRTAVAFSSDHGDYFGNYGLVEKWSGSGDDLLLHVPLAMRLPGAAGAPPQTLPFPVQTFDLLPTFLALANASFLLSSPSNVTGYRQFGEDLLPYLTPATDGAPPPPPPHGGWVYAESGYTYFTNELEYNDPTQASTWDDPTALYYPRGAEEHAAPSHTVRCVSARSSDLHAVYRLPGRGAPSELYNLTADPRQLVNVWDDVAYAPVRAVIVERLLAWFVETGDVTPLTYDPRGLPPSPPPPAEWGWVPPRS